MQDQGNGRSYYRDDEIVVDRDGLPHYTGENPDLIKEYKKRVKLALARLEGSGEDEDAAKKSVEKKQRRFRVKLLDGIHGAVLSIWPWTQTPCASATARTLPSMQLLGSTKR